MNKKLFVLKSSSKEENKCTCGDPSIEGHTCPFSADVWDDFKSLCSCCEECEHQCAMDI